MEDNSEHVAYEGTKDRTSQAEDSTCQEQKAWWNTTHHCAHSDTTAITFSAQANTQLNDCVDYCSDDQAYAKILQDIFQHLVW